MREGVALESRKTAFKVVTSLWRRRVLLGACIFRRRALERKDIAQAKVVVSGRELAVKRSLLKHCQQLSSLRSILPLAKCSLPQNAAWSLCHPLPEWSF